MPDRAVLVVEDEELVRRVVTRWVESLGYTVIAVGGADEAVAELEKSTPVAVITDIMMPVRDGIWLLEQIRTRWPSLPVVMASGAETTDVVLKAKRLGAAGFLPKPFGREAVYQILLQVTAVPEAS